MPADGAEGVRQALRSAGIEVLENDALRVSKDGQPFGSRVLAINSGNSLARGGLRTSPICPEPWRKSRTRRPSFCSPMSRIFSEHVPDSVSLTLCGHTHGGQVNLPCSPRISSVAHFGIDLIYGHIVEKNRHMIISAGLGTSNVPVRFNRPPEVVHLTIGGGTAPSQS